MKNTVLFTIARESKMLEKNISKGVLPCTYESLKGVFHKNFPLGP